MTDRQRIGKGQRIGKANKSRAKEYEREVARRLGGTRYLADTGGPSDVSTPIAEVQVKSRANVPAYIAEGLDAARAAALAEKKLGVLALVARSGPGRPNRYYVVMDLDEFAAWEGMR